MNKNYTAEETILLCEIAVILKDYNIEVNDAEDFFLNHIIPIFENWKNQFDAEENESYITDYANRVANEKY